MSLCLLEYFAVYFYFQVDDDEKPEPEEFRQTTPGSDINHKFFMPPNKSLVQCVLVATAMRDNNLEFKTVN